MSAFVIDAFEFCRLNERAEGEFPVGELTRLSGETADHVGVLKWVLVGGTGESGHPELTLAVSGPVNLICQRCLGAMSFDVSSRSTLVLARDEGAADAIEESLDDESVDVIAGSTTFDVVGLVEDEAMLALPVAPKHDACPAAATTGAATVEKVSPFSVLKNLKQ